MINIDDLIPDYKHYDPSIHKGFKFPRNAFWIHTNSSNYYSPRNAIGVKKEKILNWRALEKRYFELSCKVHEAYTRFWQEMKSVGGPVKKGLAKYIVYSDDRAYKFHDDCYSHESPVRLAEDCLKNTGTDRQEKFVLVTKENGGARVHYLDNRYKMLANCQATYYRAFHQAIEDRIKVYLDKPEACIGTTNVRYSYYKKLHVFLVENEGRSYIITNDEHGSLKWLVGDFVRLTPHEKEV